MKKINLYLVAFFAILTKTLVFTMGWPEVAALSTLLLKISFDNFLATQATQENTEPLKIELKRLSEKSNQFENSLKLIKFNTK